MTTSDLALSNDDECDNQVQRNFDAGVRSSLNEALYPLITQIGNTKEDNTIVIKGNVYRFVLQDYEDELENGRGRRHSSPGGSRGNPRDYGHHHLHPDNLVSSDSLPLPPP